MEFAFITDLFNSRAASSICWTLIHSVWQGLFFAIATGLLLLITKNTSAAFRYKLLSLQFMLFIIMVLVTFGREWQQWNASTSFQNSTPGFVITIAGETAHVNNIVHWYELLDRLSNFLTTHSSTILAAWFIIFAFKSLKIISSLVYTQHLRFYKTHEPDACWNKRLIILGRQLQLKKAVRLVESEIIKVPAVFGHLKPVIFIPLGMLAGLEPTQVEAVLLHELAHIRRNDYLFNLVQNIAETVFFFNPALLWMSALLREEREHCCDDIAIAQMKDKKQFIESLVRFRELYLYNHSKFVTAFPGTKNGFLNRITRIAMNKNKSLNPAENVFLAISLVIVSTLVMAFCQVKEPPPSKLQTTAPIVVPVVAATKAPEKTAVVYPEKDTTPGNKKQPVETIGDDYSVIYSDSDKSAGKETVVLKSEGNEYKLVKLNGEIAYLVVNDEKIPKEKLGEYSELVKKINDLIEKMRKEQEIRNKEQEKRNEEQAVRNKEQEVRNAEQAERNELQKKRNAEQEVRNKEQDKRNAEQAVRNELQKKRDAEQVIRNKEQDVRNDEQAERNELQKKRNAEQVIRNEEQAKRNAEQVIRNKEQAERNEEMKKLIEELVRDNIIKDNKDLRNLSLTTDEFVVNGVRQSPEVLKKYKAKYTKIVGSTMNYRHD